MECKICGKELEPFRRGGYCSDNCKRLQHIKIVRNYQEKNIEVFREKNRESQKKWYENNKEIQKKRVYEYMKLHPEKEKARRYTNRNKEKIFGHYGKNCMICGSDKNIEIHHLDYVLKKKDGFYKYNLKEVLDKVQVLCSNCHNIVHHYK